MPAHRIEYEKAIKRIKSYCRRNNLGTKEANKRLTHFSNNYYEELNNLEKNFTPKPKSSFDLDAKIKSFNDFSKKIRPEINFSFKSENGVTVYMDTGNGIELPYEAHSSGEKAYILFVIIFLLMMLQKKLEKNKSDTPTW